MKIYTKGGDKGRTGIHGGQRVDKDDIRIEANGCLDELNVWIGMLRTRLPEAHEWQATLYEVQRILMVVMSHVATPSAIRDQNPNVLPDTMVTLCEEQIDRMTEAMGENSFFILPGGTEVASLCHLARTAARRAERRLCTLHKADALPPLVMAFVNRLSDLFFVMARYELHTCGRGEECWQAFKYKRKSAGQ